MWFSIASVGQDRDEAHVTWPGKEELISYLPSNCRASLANLAEIMVLGMKTFREGFYQNFFLGTMQWGE